MFGRAGQPGVQVKLPKIFYSSEYSPCGILKSRKGRLQQLNIVSGDSECALAVGLNPGKISDTSSWDDIWSAAVQAKELCVKNGHSGIDETLGEWAISIFFL